MITIIMVFIVYIRTLFYRFISAFLSLIGFNKKIGLFARKYQLQLDFKKVASLSFLIRRVNHSFSIFCYHKILNNNKFSETNYSLKIFEKQMQFLAENFIPMSLEDITEMLCVEKNIPENVIAVTFDDGYKDNYLYAFPILRKFNIPATIFLITGFIENSYLPWWDIISYAIDTTMVNELKLKMINKGKSYQLTNIDNKIKFKNNLNHLLLYYNESEKLSMIRDLLDMLGIENTELQQCAESLSWEEIIFMSNNGIRFGAHTVNHPILSQIPLVQAKHEIIKSKELIEKKLGTTVKSFAYPNGKEKDFNSNTKKILHDAGFSCAVTTLHGFNNQISDFFELRRLQAFDTFIPQFELRLYMQQLIN